LFKYTLSFAPLPAMMSDDWEEAKRLLDEAVQLLPEEPLIVSLRGLFFALTKGRTGTQVLSPSLCQSKVLWARTPHVLSDRVHSRGARETPSSIRMA
jgi:hypothetical protein